MKTLYLDIDGVLCNFNKRYAELFGKTAAESRERKEFTHEWKQFINEGNFATLDYFPGALELLEFANSLEGIKVEILSSSGGHTYHDEVTNQKKLWLKEHNINYHANITPGSRLKANYANGAKTILVDDTDYVIEGFIDKGGIGILHRDVGETIRLIKEAIEQ